MGTRNQERG
jgi:NAD(P)-dependent dehydrogenase (short-subunit alcohol dehydrogenase family)